MSMQGNPALHAPTLSIAEQHSTAAMLRQSTLLNAAEIKKQIALHAVQVAQRKTRCIRQNSHAMR
jgi:hypothetical protein